MGVSVNGNSSHTDSSSSRHVVVLDLLAGDTLDLGRPREGLRAFVAVRGGFDVTPILGSRSYDTLGRLGPPPLRAGDTVPVGATLDPSADTVGEVAPGPLTRSILTRRTICS